MNTFLLHCYFEWHVHFTYANNNLGVFDFLVCTSADWQSHSSFSTTNSAASVALAESNLNRSIHFSHIVINGRSILSLKIRYISFLKDEAQRTKQICIWFCLYTVGLRLPVCVCFYMLKSRNTGISSSRHQLIRRLNNLNRFVAGRRFRLLFV